MGASLLLLASASVASASFTFSGGPSISAVDQNGAEINVALIDLQLGTDGFSVYNGPLGAQSHSYVQGYDGIYDAPGQVTSIFTNYNLSCNPEEPLFWPTLDFQNLCWSIAIQPSAGAKGSFAPIVPLTASGGLVFDHWHVTNAAKMQPVFAGQTAGIPGYCRNGDRGLERGGVAYQSYLNVATGGGMGTSYQAAYAPASPDTSPPEIGLDYLLDCATFEQGATQSAIGTPAVFNWSCADPGYPAVTGATGVVGCRGFVNGAAVANGSPIDTSTPGDYTLTVRARDVAGNVRTRTATYHVVPPFVSSVSAPPVLQGGRFVVVFSRPVHGLTPSSFQVHDAADASLAGSISCLDGASVATNCKTGQVSVARFLPSAALVAGEQYGVVLQGAKSSTITDVNGRTVSDMDRMVRAQTDFTAADPGITYRWGTISVQPNGYPYPVNILQEKWQGATQRFTFNDTALDVVFWPGPDRGRASIKITTPGQPAVARTVDTWAQFTGALQTVSFTGLSAATHTVTITVLGTKRAASTDTWIGVRGYDTPSTFQSDLTGGWSPLFGYAFTTQQGASATLQFQGSRITWNAFVGPNDGMAEITIDGTIVGDRDLYAPDYGYQDLTYTGFGPGTHTFTITVLGTKQAASSDVVVTLNRLTVL
jgi:hypothetical protein